MLGPSPWGQWDLEASPLPASGLQILFPTTQCQSKPWLGLSGHMILRLGVTVLGSILLLQPSAGSHPNAAESASPSFLAARHPNRTLK